MLIDENKFFFLGSGLKLSRPSSHSIPQPIPSPHKIPITVPTIPPIQYGCFGSPRPATIPTIKPVRIDSSEASEQQFNIFSLQNSFIEPHAAMIWLMLHAV